MLYLLQEKDINMCSTKKNRPITIIASGRCGSRLLMESLNTHPQIPIKVNEPLCYFSGVYKQFHGFIKEKFNIDPKGLFLDKHNEPEIFNKIGNAIYMEEVYREANLVKMTYGQITPSIAEWIKQQDHTIIHLSRLSYINVYISFLYARQGIPGPLGQPRSDVVKIDFTEACNFIRVHIENERMVDSYFGDRQIKLYYEDLIPRWNYWIKLIEQKAGIDVVPLVKAIQPYKRRRGSASVSNFDQISKLCEVFGEQIVNWQAI